MVATRSEDILNRLEELESRFNSEINKNTALESKIVEMAKNFQAEREVFQGQIDEMINDLYIIESQFYNMDVRLIEVEQYSRRESLVITGIPDTVNQRDLEGVVVNILRTIGVNIQSYDISACHRLFKKKGDISAKTIIRFVNRKIVGLSLLKKSLLFKCKNTLNLPYLGFEQHLCAANERVRRECKKLCHYGLIQDYFSWNGFIKIVQNNNTRALKINHIDELFKRFDDFYQYENLYKI